MHARYSKGKIRPETKIVDKGEPILFKPEDKDQIRVDMSMYIGFLGLDKMTNPRETIEKLVKEEITQSKA